MKTSVSVWLCWRLRSSKIKLASLDPTADMTSRIGAVLKRQLEILTDVKASAHELHSPRLEYLDIAGVMRSFCKEFGERKRVQVDFKSHDLPNHVPPDISLCLFRVLQEALHNAVKHSGVRQFDGHLWGTTKEIHLTVSDCGLGFNLETAMQARGLGLPHAGAAETREGNSFHRFAAQARDHDPRSRASPFRKCRRVRALRREEDYCSLVAKPSGFPLGRGFILLYKTVNIHRRKMLTVCCFTKP
jgi:hypothetical protein